MVSSYLLFFACCLNEISTRRARSQKFCMHEKKIPGMLTICIHKFQGHQTGLNTTKHQIIEAMNRDEKGLKI